MSIDQMSLIKSQKSQIFKQDHFVKLDSACNIGHGIIQLNEDFTSLCLEEYKNLNSGIAFFIPASGSGSRMFNFLFDYDEENESKEVQQFFKNLKEFALYHSIPQTVREKFEHLKHKYIVEYLINPEGMNYKNLPKGLIPFHLEGDKIITPFQEQIRQAALLMKKKGSVHFTVQKGLENDVIDSIELVDPKALNKVEVSLSNQNKETDAFCFKLNGEPFVLNGEQVRRPAGHGALLENLIEIDEDIVLVKNIDNIQHGSKSNKSQEVWKNVLGLLLLFKSELKDLAKSFSNEKLHALNQKYEFLSKQEIESFDQSELARIISRPTRVCGMVKNEGAPGGGPFWVESNGRVSKQIVEKIQISSQNDQQEILEKSSHFNPVFIALSKSDVEGNALDLTQFVDDTKNLVVEKPHHGEQIIYRELPGLWNGAMSDWNSIFVEIPSEVFSPVKTALDLLSDEHKA